MAEYIEYLVIGAGAVGLAIGRALADAGKEVIVADAEKAIGIQTSSRNSQVIHAGIYYPSGSLKAKLCVAGRKLLYPYCEQHNVAHERIGKVILATSAEEVPCLHQYQEQALRNGVDDLILMTADEVAAREPAVNCVAGLWSPSTGILDSHAYMLSLQADLEAAGGAVALGNRVEKIRVGKKRFTVRLSRASATTFECHKLVNSAGLNAQDVAHSIEGLNGETIPPLYFAKGHYFSLGGNAPFNHLIYPVAGKGGLGIHVTKDMAGRCRFGPDVQWLDTVDYSFDETRRHNFHEAISKYYQDINEEMLVPDYTGIRPKLAPCGAPAADFVIQDYRSHGVVGLINLFGIESPGLTASLAIAESVRDRLVT
jgi:L-2-hydroxyglutarate oxidase LhgO